jgi:DNA-binding HxlR family transcriptional regulator
MAIYNLTVAYMTTYDYKVALDRLIMEILFTEEPYRYRYRALKRRIEKPLDHQISFDTYDRHIDRLVEHQFLKKKKEGKRVFYSLTQRSRNKLSGGETIDTTI